MSLPPFSALRAFEAAVRLGSFRAAAQALNLSESAVSHQVRRLESWLGRPLFAREGRSLNATAEAVQFSQRLGEALSIMHSATAALRESTRNTLTISAPPAIANGWLLPRLPQFQDHAPNVELRLHPSTRTVDFARDDVDVGLRYAVHRPEGLHAEHLLREVAYPVAGPAFLTRHPGPHTPDSLHALPRVHNTLHPGEWSAWAMAQGVSPAPPADTESAGGASWDKGMALESADAVLRAALAGLGVALGRRPLVDDMLAEGSLSVIADAVLDEGCHYWFVCPPETLRRPAVRAFRDWLHAELARSAPDRNAHAS